MEVDNLKKKALTDTGRPLWNNHVTIKRLPAPNLLFRAPPQTLICIIGTTSVERVREGRMERG